VRALLDEFRKRIVAALDAVPGDAETPLLPGLQLDDPLAPVRRHADALRRRRDAIDGEIARETARIAHRFSKLEWRVFPVAVTFLVPGRFAR
jgi:hypothetical protein